MFQEYADGKVPDFNSIKVQLEHVSIHKLMEKS